MFSHCRRNQLRLRASHFSVIISNNNILYKLYPIIRPLQCAPLLGYIPVYATVACVSCALYKVPSFTLALVTHRRSVCPSVCPSAYMKLLLCSTRACLFLCSTSRVITIYIYHVSVLFALHDKTTDFTRALYKVPAIPILPVPRQRLRIWQNPN